MRNEAPVELQYLCIENESMPFRRRGYEAEILVIELGRRIRTKIRKSSTSFIFFTRARVYLTIEILIVVFISVGYGYYHIQ